MVQIDVNVLLVTREAAVKPVSFADYFPSTSINCLYLQCTIPLVRRETKKRKKKKRRICFLTLTLFGLKA